MFGILRSKFALTQSETDKACPSVLSTAINTGRRNTRTKNPSTKTVNFAEKLTFVTPPQQKEIKAPDPKTRFKLTPNKREREKAAREASRPLRKTIARLSLPRAIGLSRRPLPTPQSKVQPLKVLKPAPPRPGPNRFKLSPNKFTKAASNAAELSKRAADRRDAPER